MNSLSFSRSDLTPPITAVARRLVGAALASLVLIAPSGRAAVLPSEAFRP
jgi:hypothetical protein